MAKYDNLKVILYFIIVFVYIIAMLILIFHIMGNTILDETEIECSIWENGSTWFGDFNCYCPMGDYAGYANVKYLNNCNHGYLRDKWEGSNYYSELN